MPILPLHSPSDDSFSVSGFIIISIIFGFILWVFFITFSDIEANLTPDQKCKKFYGVDYTYQYGGQAPDLCIKKDGTRRYYELIK